MLTQEVPAPWDFVPELPDSRCRTHSGVNVCSQGGGDGPRSYSTVRRRHGHWGGNIAPFLSLREGLFTDVGSQCLVAEAGGLHNGS